jgi:hypothetical protein
MLSELFNGCLALMKEEMQNFLRALLGLLSHGGILRALTSSYALRAGRNVTAERDGDAAPG